MNLQNILIVKLSAIGDVIHALPVAYALKKTYPAVKLTWVVEPPAYELLQENPYIDEVILFEKKKFKSFWGFWRNYPRFARRIRQVKYDAVLDLQGLFKSAVIAWTARGARRLGVCDMRELSDLVSQPVVGANCGGHIVERYLDVARALGCNCDEVVFPLLPTAAEKRQAAMIVEHAGVKNQNPYVVLAVGANWPNKRWPTRYFAQLCDWLYARELIPVLCGSGVVDERLVVDITAQAEIPPVDIVGRTTLRQLAAVMQNARAVVGGDTGTVHLAAGLGVPVLMLLGPTDANRNGPYKQPHNAIEVGYDCRHCWKRQCAKERECLEGIPLAEVTQHLESIL